MSELRLELGSNDVAIQQLVQAAEAFSGLIREVARTYAGTRQDPVRWVVRLERGSVGVPVDPQPALDDLRPSATPEIVAAIANGVACLEQAPERPDFFTDKALVAAKQLADLNSPSLPVSIHNGQVASPLTERLVRNVEAVLGQPTLSYGTVEGLLEQLNVHGQRNDFSVFDARNGQKVPCRFTDRVRVEDIGPAIQRRVAVRGLIRTRPNGRRDSIDAHELSVFPPDQKLATPDDVLGILKGAE